MLLSPNEEAKKTRSLQLNSYIYSVASVVERVVAGDTTGTERKIAEMRKHVGNIDRVFESGKTGRQ
jgi:hypothetical protein